MWLDINFDAKTWKRLNIWVRWKEKMHRIQKETHIRKCESGWIKTRLHSKQQSSVQKYFEVKMKI